ncbi:MAG: hypothetical protein SLAVMIC_00707 [uncultured marine phage]|uniref:Uncharacterized protein n=1 Tax=uncultured marine phage TaxID=707152 RepID=A0A8D9CCM7_9VIRU|nr:MAG: hypothetical protein SLAVMIC_00707 [uncultured marine phage]
MITVSTITISVLMFLFIILFIREHIKRKKLKDSYKDIKKKHSISNKRNIELSTMFLSERALCTLNLTHGKTHQFKITYEVEIVEMTKKSAKVNVINYQTDDTKMGDPKYKKILVDYLDGDWVDLDKMEYVIDSDAIKRDIRLSQLLDKDT